MLLIQRASIYLPICVSLSIFYIYISRKRESRHKNVTNLPQGSNEKSNSVIRCTQCLKAVHCPTWRQHTTLNWWLSYNPKSACFCSSRCGGWGRWMGKVGRYEFIFFSLTSKYLKTQIQINSLLYWSFLIGPREWQPKGQVNSNLTVNFKKLNK